MWKLERYQVTTHGHNDKQVTYKEAQLVEYSDLRGKYATFEGWSGYLLTFTCISTVYHYPMES